MKYVPYLSAFFLFCTLNLKGEEIYDQKHHIKLDVQGSTEIHLIIEKSAASEDLITLTFSVLPSGYIGAASEALLVRLPDMTNIAGTVRHSGLALAFPRESIKVVAKEQWGFAQSEGQWKRLPSLTGTDKELLGLAAEIVTRYISENVVNLKPLSVAFELSNKIAEYYHQSEADNYQRRTEYSFDFEPFSPASRISARKVSFTIQLLSELNGDAPLAFLMDGAVVYTRPIKVFGGKGDRQGSGRLDLAIPFPLDAGAEGQLATKTSPGEFPRPIGYVNDFAGIIDAQAEKELEALVAEYDRLTSNQIVIATVKTIMPYADDKAFSTDLFNAWGIGVKDKNNGVLFLVATGERRVRITVGYGLESILTDEICGGILDRVVIPELKGENYGAGLGNGIQEVIRILNR